MNYKLIIKEILKEKFKEMKLISETSNKVYKITTQDNENLYAKFYQNNSSHIDNELKVYDLIDNKYLKEIYYQSERPKMAIFKELVGKTIDELTEEELQMHSNQIISSVYDYFNSIKEHKTQGYGILDQNLFGKYEDFHEFLKIRQNETANILKEYEELNCIFDLIYEKYKSLIQPDNSLVPIDTNLKNIMVLTDGTIKFCDPGEMISAPILMGYGDFVAHIYKTPLYEKLLNKLKLTTNEEKLLRIYAVFSSLNILAFLKKNKVNELKNIIPFGNTHTFYYLINEHLQNLKIKSNKIKKLQQ